MKKQETDPEPTDASTEKRKAGRPFGRWKHKNRKEDKMKKVQTELGWSTKAVGARIVKRRTYP